MNNVDEYIDKVQSFVTTFEDNNRYDLERAVNKFLENKYIIDVPHIQYCVYYDTIDNKQVYCALVHYISKGCIRTPFN